MNTEEKINTINREKVMNALLETHQSYFDMFPCQEGYLVARGDFHVHSEKYVLIKKAKLWEADCNEFVYFFSVGQLTAEILDKCIDLAYREGMPKIEPKDGHMYSYITALFVCDECDGEALKKLKKCRIHKEFKFSLHGWMDFHSGVIVCGQGTTAFNKSGKDKKKLLDDIVTCVTKS